MTALVLGGRGPRTANRLIWGKAQGTPLGCSSIAHGTRDQAPSSTGLGPRYKTMGRGPRNNTRGSAAQIQRAPINVHGPSTMATGAWVNSKGQGSELKAQVPSFLRPQDQDADPWPMVQSPAAVGELGLGLATFAAQYNNAWPRQRHGHKTPNHIRAEQRRLAINVATGLNMAA